MRFISIDPSLRNTAIVAGIITEDNELEPLTYELITTTKSKDKKRKSTDDLIDRCRHIYNKMHSLINQTVPNEKTGELFSEFAHPDFIFVESPSGSQSASAAKSYAISCFLIATLYPSAYTVTPNELKVMTQGSKTATKHEMVTWAQERFPEFKFPMHGDKVNMSKSEHIADALAAAVAGFKKLNS